MNTDNVVELHGTVHADPVSGACWTRWKPGGRGQVRFWLAVSRDLAGEGLDILLCCVEPKTAQEVDQLEREIRPGRSVHLVAQARRVAQGKGPARCEEDSMTIVFIAESCGLDGAPLRDAHKLGTSHRRHHAYGKMAAAGDVDQPELLAMQGDCR